MTAKWREILKKMLIKTKEKIEKIAPYLKKKKSQEDVSGKDSAAKGALNCMRMQTIVSKCEFHVYGKHIANKL